METMLDSTPGYSMECLAPGDRQAYVAPDPEIILPARGNNGVPPPAIDDPRAAIDEISTMAAQLLAVDACMIMLLAGHVDAEPTFRTHCSAAERAAPKDRARRGETAARRAIRAGHSLVIGGRSAVTARAALPRDGSGAERIVVAPIRIAGEIIGAIACFTPCRTRCDAPLLTAIEIVATLVGQALNALRLEGVLHSRFAQLAILVAGRNKADEALVVARNEVGQLARILAKSFYREMVRLGCDSGQIVDAASEIISQLSGSLKKHRDRLRRAPTNTLAS
jgi:hypothetical protein